MNSPGPAVQKSGYMPPKKVFALLNRIFCRFDELTEERGLERIKTIGDGYMVAGGLNAHPREPHAAAASLAPPRPDPTRSSSASSR